MFKRLLIANRGEIACRIGVTAQRLGIETVAVYSDADRASRHVAMADTAVNIGPAPATESYLDPQKIIDAAAATGAEAVHPGYGFLSESADFADACAGAGLVFVGPSSHAMRRLGRKDEAKRIAEAAGVPIVPGYFGETNDIDTLVQAAASIGYPLMVKAVAGGGGRGMRRVEHAGDLRPALESAAREAGGAFGDASLMLEKVIARPRHIEVQIFGDTHGNVVHLYERDCTLQRRHQKVIEEAPAPGISAGLRRKMTSAAVSLAKSVGYSGAGTVEFLVERGELRKAAPFYFIEMNTRLQVEHPVTEAVTGIDLVEWQLAAAAGEPLPLKQNDIACEGHAVEARLYAEDPEHGFRPSTGRLLRLKLGEGAGIRLETGVREGDEVTPFYDPMISKVIAHGKNRSDAMARLDDAIQRSIVLGVKTNALFLHRLLNHPAVHKADFDTSMIDREIETLLATAGNVDEDPVCKAATAGLGALLWVSNRPSGSGPWDRNDAFQLGPVRRIARTILVDGTETNVSWAWHLGGLRVTCRGNEYDGTCHELPCVLENEREALVWSNLQQVAVAWLEHAAGRDHGEAGDGNIVAPITGRVTEVAVKQGDSVGPGDKLVIIEAMKMEHVLAATMAGKVKGITAAVGDQVTEGQSLIQIEADEIS